MTSLFLVDGPEGILGARKRQVIEPVSLTSDETICNETWPLEWPEVLGTFDTFEPNPMRGIRIRNTRYEIFQISSLLFSDQGREKDGQNLKSRSMRSVVGAGRYELIDKRILFEI